MEKGDFGMGDSGKAHTTPAVVGSMAAKKPQYTMADFKSAKATMAPGYTSSQNTKMPAAQQSMKMPSPVAPKMGFSKNELAKDEETMNKYFTKGKK